MSRLRFDFRFSGTVTLSFDPEEFAGLTEDDIRGELRKELPGELDLDDLNAAASALHEAANGA